MEAAARSRSAALTARGRPGGSGGMQGAARMRVPFSLCTKAPWGASGTPFQTVMGLGYPGSMVFISSLYLQYLKRIKTATTHTQGEEVTPA